MPTAKPRSGGHVLVAQLEVHGVTHAYAVPGESYLDVLDGLHDSGMELTVCRQEGGAAMMAEAHGKLTGTPGICFVTRAPGATNASAGVHIAKQDSTPMILFVGQVRRDTRGREGFQELDYRATFSDLAKWVVEVDETERLPEVVARAFHVACNGRPGPVVVALPEDMLTEQVTVRDARPYQVAEPSPSETDLEAFMTLLRTAERPLIVAGGSRWSAEAVDRLQAWASRENLPVATSFRRRSLFPGSHPNYAGELGVACEPAMATFFAESDLVVLLGGRFSEMPSQGWSLLDIPTPQQTLVHVHPGVEELGRVYQAELAINASPIAFMAALEHADTGPATARFAADGGSRQVRTAQRHAERLAWCALPTTGYDSSAGHADEGRARNLPGHANPADDAADCDAARRGEHAGGAEAYVDAYVDATQVVAEIARQLAPGTIVTNGAGNYATWVHRFHAYDHYITQLAPTSGSMGYGVPAAVAAARLNPAQAVVAFAGDGCFLMHGQEFATAVQYALPVIVIVLDNGMYGTIRMHQELHYPGRVSGTALRNPDFAAYARAFGGHGEHVERTEQFAPALARAIASAGPAILHCLTDPQAITIERTLDTISGRAAS